LFVGCLVFVDLFVCDGCLLRIEPVKKKRPKKFLKEIQSFFCLFESCHTACEKELEASMANTLSLNRNTCSFVDDLNFEETNI